MNVLFPFEQNNTSAWFLWYTCITHIHQHSHPYRKKNIPANNYVLIIFFYPNVAIIIEYEQIHWSILDILVKVNNFQKLYK